MSTEPQRIAIVQQIIREHITGRQQLIIDLIGSLIFSFTDKRPGQYTIDVLVIRILIVQPIQIFQRLIISSQIRQADSIIQAITLLVRTDREQFVVSFQCLLIHFPREESTRKTSQCPFMIRLYFQGLDITLKVAECQWRLIRIVLSQIAVHHPKLEITTRFSVISQQL